MEDIVTRTEIGGNAGRRAYKQELHRSLGLWENISLVVSAVTPATGAFIIAPVLFTLTGTGAPLTFVIAAVMGLALAFCWAELGCAYPIAGGDYTFVARILGRPAGFVSLILSGPVQAVLIPAVVALGIGQYVGVILNVNTNILAAVIILLGAAVAILGVRLSAIAVGVLLAIELLAVVFVGVLGLFHVQRPISTLFQPLITDSDGATHSLTMGALVAGIAVASFAYNGFQGALLYSEETTGSRRNVARSVFIALGVAVACEVLPVSMAILSSPSLADLSASPNAWQYFLTSIGGDAFNTIISLGIAIAVLNAVVALMPFFARILYSSGRDMAWPAPMSKALASVHPRWGTPWISTIVVGAAGAVLVLFTDVATLSTCVGAVLCVEFILVAASAILSRLKDKSMDRPYRMPLWPAAPIVAIVMSVVVLTQQTSSDLLVAGGIVVVSLAYYLVYLRPRRHTHMLMLDPVRPVEAISQRRHPAGADVNE